MVLYGSAAFEAEARRSTAGVGVDVVYDSVGAATFEQSLRSLKPRGRIDRQLPLADAEAARRALEGRQTQGEVLLLP